VDDNFFPEFGRHEVETATQTRKNPPIEMTPNWLVPKLVPEE
jgi:hypothetical protein